MTHHYPAFWPALWGCDRALSSRWRLKGSGGARPQYSPDGYTAGSGPHLRRPRLRECQR